MIVSIIAGAPIPPANWAKPIINESDLVIAADAGARHLASLEKIPDLVIGDLDSLSPEEIAAIQKQSLIYRFPVDKEQTDLELAATAALRAGAQKLCLFSWADDCLDYSLNPFSWLSSFQIPVDLFTSSTWIILLQAGRTSWQAEELKRFNPSLEFPRKASVYPLSENIDLETRGFRWPLKWQKSRSQNSQKKLLSQSNEVLSSDASLNLKEGRAMLVIHF